MSEAVQIAPFVSAFSDDGEFTLRVDDSPLAKAIAPMLIKAIGEQERARKLTLLTPTDTKIFKFGVQNGKAISSNAPTQVETTPPKEAETEPEFILEQDDNAPPSPELVALDQEQQEAARAAREMERLNRASSVMEIPEATTSRRVQRPKADAPVKPASPCGRCEGTGQVVGGGSCPVCRGKGSITHFGRRARG